MTENKKFRLKPIAELLDGKHHFYIPSYQRGYRWETEQVEDLLNDISDFIRDSKSDSKDFQPIYCLQPVVVKKTSNSKSKWEVIDGQQRLTTILLLLNFLKVNYRNFTDGIDSKLYTIEYHTRPNLDFRNPIKESDIDSLFAANTINKINNWFTKPENSINIEDFINSLIKPYDKASTEPQVKIIWYIDESPSNLESIQVFNNLNKGKIGLTNSELIKALYILKSKKESTLNSEQIMLEWNEMENQLQDNRFWLFLVNKENKYQTRIDLIFDFLTRKPYSVKDRFYSYRKFQELYDSKNHNDFWDTINVNNFFDAWTYVKRVFQTFTYWYENNLTYHYVGFLVSINVPLTKIFDETIYMTKSQTEEVLVSLISDELNLTKDELSTINYTDNRQECRNILLLHNIQTMVNQSDYFNKTINNFISHSYNRFPFDLFKLNKWDIEHVDSQEENSLEKTKDKIIWLSYISHIEINDIEWKDIQNESEQLYRDINKNQSDKGNKFGFLYKKIIDYIRPNKNHTTTHTLDNLVLLDAGTNRGYKNALFPTKRMKIIEKDSVGQFIPICTKNLFLKYYTNSNIGGSQFNNRWETNDKKEYLNDIRKTLNFILKEN